MNRWLVAAAYITATIWLVSKGTPAWAIAISVALDIGAIVRAARGDK